EKGRWTPTRSSWGPTRPRRPRARSRAVPPTTGGRTMGRVVRARTRLRPRYSTRACTPAKGTPRARARAVADTDVTRDRRRAWPASSEVSAGQAFDQGAFHSSPARGRANRAAAAPATTTGAAGARSRAPRDLPPLWL